MAPRTRASVKANDATAPSKHSDTRVVKRPTRGYHTFKDGRLNVTPMADELELVELNQNAPILSLPPEIRNRIFELVLGGKTMRHTYLGHGESTKIIFKNAPRDRKNATALIRTCRQIYVETLTLPYARCTFSTPYYHDVYVAFKRFRAHQRRLINTIHFELMVHEVEHFALRWLSDTDPALGIPKWLLSLQHVHVCLFSSDGWKWRSFAERETTLRSLLDSDMSSRAYKLSIDMMDGDWHHFDGRWKANPVSTTT
ncbi:hypothetical protein EK21DRAFT_112320 [Setomelanomma holmii]|uniref:DUF7730 domain-containing protein n=1 Tax=Setomelanomma holmii TaxID=210430 RepID=A0A9P4H9J4_9PLEO|nr:hypothetical protein EK21DRAFT_112320 [Setomelanomma holmii]